MYTDKLVKYMSLKNDQYYKDGNTKYLSLNNLNNPKAIFSYKAYQDQEGIAYSANIYYWYYLCLILI
jgi:hypothetical protein